MSSSALLVEHLAASNQPGCHESYREVCSRDRELTKTNDGQGQSTILRTVNDPGLSREALADEGAGRRLDLLSALQRASESHRVCVLEIAPHWEPAPQACHADFQ